LITVVLGGSSGASRNANVEDLLLTGFDIERRRDHGEQVMLTQNMFEPPPPAGVTVPQVAQGDASDPIDLVLNAAAQGRSLVPGQAPAAMLSASRPSLLAEMPSAGFLTQAAPQTPQAAPQALRAARNWTVEVGSFTTNRQATRQVDLVADRFKSLFDDREGEVDRIGRRYQAVFTGFTEAEADQACAKVQGDDLPCVTRGR
jgi:D-alanyl-D-alanine carboxypeptidase (penicillin-binding protein 5/6)